MSVHAIFISTSFIGISTSDNVYRLVTIGAGIVIVIALISLSLVQELWHMFTIVPLLGLGMGLAYQASCSFYITYFDKRFAFASGLNSSAAGLGMFILPPLIETLIQFYGWRGALQIVAAIMANICVCGSLLRPSNSERLEINNRNAAMKMNERSSLGEANSKQMHRSCLTDAVKDFDLSLFYNMRFVFQSCVNGILFLGNYAAIVYFVPYAISIGVSSLKASFLMSVSGICLIIARVSPVGCIVDNKIISASTLGGIAYVLGGLAIMVMPFTSTFEELICVAIAIGLTTGLGGWLLIVVVAYSAGSRDKAPGAIAWLSLHCGIANVLGLLLTGYLFDAYGSYKPSLVFGGICVSCVGAVILSDPLLIKLQTLLERKMKKEHTNNANCSNTINACRSITDDAMSTPV